jgi:hypothetical protein
MKQVKNQNETAPKKKKKKKPIVLVQKRETRERYKLIA